MLKYRAVLEFHSKSYGPAVIWANRLLEQKADDSKALEIREKGIQQLRIQLEELEAPKPKTVQ
jgi:hypothetical protein